MWAYRPHERSKDKAHKIVTSDNGRPSKKPRKKKYDFDYLSHKAFLEQRMDEEYAKKQEEATKK